MQQNIIAQGFELMLYGMGTVLVFLTVLVIATVLMCQCIARFFPAAMPSQARALQQAGAPDARHVAVISAAIARHRSERPS